MDSKLQIGLEDCDPGSASFSGEWGNRFLSLWENNAGEVQLIAISGKPS
jgi:hypothetical protein